MQIKTNVELDVDTEATAISKFTTILKILGGQIFQN